MEEVAQAKQGSSCGLTDGWPGGSLVLWRMLTLGWLLFSGRDMLTMEALRTIERRIVAGWQRMKEFDSAELNRRDLLQARAMV